MWVLWGAFFQNMVNVVCWNSFNFSGEKVDGGGVPFYFYLHIKHIGLYLHCMYNWLFSVIGTTVCQFWFNINSLIQFFMSKILVLYFSLRVFCIMQQGRATLPYLSHFLLAWVTGDLLTFAACPVAIINRKLHFKLQHTQS